MTSTATQTAKSTIPEHGSGSTQSTKPENVRSSESSTNRMDPSSVGEDHKHQKIAQLAYSYWRARDDNQGSAEEDWLRAEAEVDGTGSAKSE